MESIRNNVVRHGRIASVKLLPDCIIDMAHVDGHRCSFALADLCEHGEIVGVQLIGGGEGILVAFDDGHEHRLSVAGVRARSEETPSILPALSEERVRELAL